MKWPIYIYIFREIKENEIKDGLLHFFIVIIAWRRKKCFTHYFFFLLKKIILTLCNTWKSSWGICFNSSASEKSEKKNNDLKHIVLCWNLFIFVPSLSCSWIASITAIECTLIVMIVRKNKFEWKKGFS